MKTLILLGASGSIGSQTIDIIKENPSDYLLVAFSVGERADAAERICKIFPGIQTVCFKNRKDALAFGEAHPKKRALYGDEGLLTMLQEVHCDMVVNALVGFVGLAPTIKALELNRTVALANKESLVVGGKLVNDLLDQGHGRLIPIDSEHVGIHKLLRKAGKKPIKKIHITASGGALRNIPLEDLCMVTAKEALAHPTWKMGKKITIDCATMMNKGFELIEACVLYRRPMEDFAILMHDESQIHAALEFQQGGYLCDVSAPDMHRPIAYALCEGKCRYKVKKVKDLSKFKKFHFHQFEPRRYPAVGLCKKAYAMGGNAMAILNAANEVAVEAFLAGRIRYLRIAREVEVALQNIPYIANPTLTDLISTDRLTRGFATERMKVFR